MSGLKRNGVGHCLMAWGILALLLLLVSVSTIVPWGTKMATYDESIENRLFDLKRFQNMLGQKAGLEQALGGLENHGAIKGQYLTGDTDALAAAELQSKIKRVVDEHGGALVSTQIVTSGTKADEAPRITVRVRMKGETPTLLGVIYALEAGKPLIFIDNLSVRSPKGRRTKASELDINFDLYGFRQQVAQ